MPNDTAIIDPNAGLREMIAAETARLDEADAFHSNPNAVRPIGNPYVSSPQTTAERRQYLAEMKLRAGIVDPPPETADDIARRRIDESHRIFEAPELDSLMEADIERIEALPAVDRLRLVRDLETESGGPERYRALIADAKSAFEPGQWREGIECSRPVLRYLAALGRQTRHHAAEHAALDATIAARAGSR